MEARERVRILTGNPGAISGFTEIRSAEPDPHLWASTMALDTLKKRETK